MIRRFSTSLLTIVALVLVVNIDCQAQSLAPLTRHVRDVTLNGQAKSAGRLPATQSMRLTLVLPLRNQAGLDSFLEELYDPSSPSYRQFLTVEEFTAKFGPTQYDYDTVTRFAEENGFTVVGTSRNRMNLDVMGTVASIEAAFHLTMGLYQHPTENRTFYAPDREPAPILTVQLWHISGLDNYSIPKPALVRRNAGAKPAATTGSCPSASFCGSDMRAAYYGGALTGSGQSLGLLEYSGTDLIDLQTYYTNAGQAYPGGIITILPVPPGIPACKYPACDDTEQTVDMTQALGMAPGLSSLVMYVGTASPVNDTAIFNAMATANPLNAQLSCSWIWSPADPNTDNPYFEEFAAQGQNLFQASGDSGKWTSNVWPADSVYLTSVGGTDLTTSSAGGPWSSETAFPDGGGGISPDDFKIPSWQTRTAAGCSNCSKTYRNGPDVSANANFTFYVCADQTACTANLYGGTSFSAPMWAGFLALANEQAVIGSGHTLGFINPALYGIGLSASYQNDFHDITSGSNGYPATTGYDLATGWGSPKSNLINALVTNADAPLTSVALGTDYFTSVPGAVGPPPTGTYFIPPGSTAVPLMGLPLPGYLTVDTKVTRTENAVFTSPAVTGATPAVFTAKIPIQLTALSLTGNLLIGTNNCAVTITLDPAHLAMDTGTMTLTVTSNTGGTFNSTLTVYYLATFAPVPPCPGPLTGSYTMTQSGGTWSTTPPAGAYLTVTEPANCIPTSPPTAGHCLGTPDQAANNHSGLPPGVKDFYLTGPGIENGPTASHVVCSALMTQTSTDCKQP